MHLSYHFPRAHIPLVRQPQGTHIHIFICFFSVVDGVLLPHRLGVHHPGGVHTVQLPRSKPLGMDVVLDILDGRAGPHRIFASGTEILEATFRTDALLGPGFDSKL